MDHSLGPVVDSILPHVEELIIVRGNEGVWERWEAAARAKSDVIYTQDDDAVVDVAAVIGAHVPGLVTCNMPAHRRPEYQDGIALVGWGCVFDKQLAYFDIGGDDANDEAFVRYIWTVARPTITLDPIFKRECDRVFTGLSPLNLIDVPFRHLHHAHGSDRMGTEKRHGDDLAEIRRRIYAIRQASK